MHLEIINASTKSIRSDIAVSMQYERSLLDCLKIAELSEGMAFDLSYDEIEVIKTYLPDDIDFFKDDVFVLRGEALIDQLTYEVHTGRELDLMLKGAKPMSVFSALSPDINNLAQIPEMEFDEYVAQGKFIKHEYSEMNGESTMRFVYYALPDQIWRVEAHKLLQKTAQLLGWNDGLTRMEGALLGYTDAQNDEYLELIKV